MWNMIVNAIYTFVSSGLKYMINCEKNITGFSCTRASIKKVRNTIKNEVFLFSVVGNLENY